MSPRKQRLIEFAESALRSFITADADHRKLRVTIRRIKRQEAAEVKARRAMWIAPRRYRSRLDRMNRTGAPSLTPSKHGAIK